MKGETYIALVHRLSCVVCVALGVAQIGPTVAHHIREGQGGAQRAPDELACALCHEHHQGNTGIHGDRSAWRLAKLTELDAVALTVRGVFELLGVAGRIASPASRPIPSRPAAVRRSKGRTATPSKILPRNFP